MAIIVSAKCEYCGTKFTQKPLASAWACDALGPAVRKYEAYARIDDVVFGSRHIVGHEIVRRKIKGQWRHVFRYYLSHDDRPDELELWSEAKIDYKVRQGDWTIGPSEPDYRERLAQQAS